MDCKSAPFYYGGCYQTFAVFVLNSSDVFKKWKNDLDILIV